jgi:hypothetical protein
MTPTLEELEFWRLALAAARATIERPTLDNARRLAKLGEKARTVRVPGWKIPGRLQLFRAFNIAARTGEVAGLGALADQVEAVLDEGTPERRDLA